MNYYNFIINPKNGKSYSIFSRKGKKILRKYLIQYGGGIAAPKKKLTNEELISKLEDHYKKNPIEPKKGIQQLLVEGQAVFDKKITKEAISKQINGNFKELKITKMNGEIVTLDFLEDLTSNLKETFCPYGKSTVEACCSTKPFKWGANRWKRYCALSDDDGESLEGAKNVWYNAKNGRWLRMRMMRLF